MTIGAYLVIMKRYWRTLLALTLLGVLGAFALTTSTPKVYSATTTQFVRGVPGASGTAEYQAAQFATSRAKSYSALIGNPDVLSGVISQLSLRMSPGELLSRLTVDNPTDTVLINVTARGTTADEAQSISVAAADNLAKLIIRLESAGATGGKSPIDIQTAVPASLPTTPSSPRPVLNYAVGTLLGLALGSILALWRHGRRESRREGAADDKASRTQALAPEPPSSSVPTAAHPEVAEIDPPAKAVESPEGPRKQQFGPPRAVVNVGPDSGQTGQVLQR